MSIEQLFYLSDLFGVAVFAITGDLMAGRKSMDLFGVLVIAIITALGGGTLRDLILDNHPVSWIRNDLYILVASLSAVGTVLWVRLTRPIHESGLLLADAFGLAVFTVIGTEVALQNQVPNSTAVIMGVMTGVAGGVKAWVRVIPAARPFAAITIAILRDASSIISSPSMTAPLAPHSADV